MKTFLKTKMLLVAMLLCFSVSTKAQLDHTNAFITIWDTQYLDNGTWLVIPTYYTDYKYYWEKVGSESTNNSGSDYQSNAVSDLTLTAITANSGVYKLYIKTDPMNGGDFRDFNMVKNANTAKALTEVQSWGNIEWKDMQGAFSGCTHLTTLPTQAPNLTQVTRLNDMFKGATVFNQDISNWDVSNITYMDNMFNGASAFNQNIGSWNVSNVNYMYDMFKDAKAFNQDISSWNVSNVYNMSEMFRGATAFNQNIGGWNVSNVLAMESMFADASAFNQNLGNWQFYYDVQLSNMLDNSGLSSQNFGLTLKGWAESGMFLFNARLGAAGLKYPAGYQSYVDILTNDWSWQITSAGVDETTLPVNLLSYTAKANSNTAVLQWQTANEVNNKGFEIWRKVEGGGQEGRGLEGAAFVKIGAVGIQTPSAFPPSTFYIFTDKHPLNGNNYYKLVQIDNDGKATVLGVRTVTFQFHSDSYRNSTFNLYPNPASNNITLNLGNKKGTVTITDALGRVKTKLGYNASAITIDISAYPSGLYFYQLSNIKGKFIKQ